jgi:hypothetical protein
MDAILMMLPGLFAASLLAFLLGLIPYPFGLLILAAFIAARIAYLQGPGKRGR